MSAASLHFVEVPDEDLRAGDVVDVLGRKTITMIRPYVGPLKDIVLGIADTEPGVGFSLCYGQRTRALRPATLTFPTEVCS